MLKLAKLRSLSLLVMVAMLSSACALAGVRMLGAVTLKDGSAVEYVQVKTKGQSGPDVTVVEGFKTTAGKATEKITSYSGSAPGMAEVIAGGLAGSLPLAGGMVGAAAVLRPSRTNVQQSVSGVSEASGGDAAAAALQFQGQGQWQSQKQGQSAEAIAVSKSKATGVGVGIGIIDP